MATVVLRLTCVEGQRWALLGIARIGVAGQAEIGEYPRRALSGARGAR